MIRFFRQIRKRLLVENKTGKYLKYAISEIMLVVIGILIALQINNWNDSSLDSLWIGNSEQIDNWTIVFSQAGTSDAELNDSIKGRVVNTYFTFAI